MKKLLILLALGAISVSVLAFSGSFVTAAVPHLINYQGMLTDNLGNPLNGTPDITFEIWNAPSAGTRRWWEIQSNVPVVNGLFNVILGNVNPINLSFYEDANYWLQIIVEEDTIPSRLEFTSVAFAYRAQKSDTAAYAISGGNYSHNHDADYVNVIGPDSIRYTGGSYAFRVLSYNEDGIYIYAPGSGGDGIYVDSAANYGVAIHDVNWAGVYINDSEHEGIWINDIAEYGIYLQNVNDDGINIFSAGGNGLHVQLADHGVYIDSTRGGYDGMYIRYSEDDGIYVGHADDNGLEVTKAGDHGIVAHGDNGNLLDSDNISYYALYVVSYAGGNSNPGLYVDGTAHCTGGGWSKSVPGSSGDVPAFAVSSREVELIASGTGTLVNGKAQIAFDSEFQEAISSEIPVKVVLTAQGAPSGLLYVASKSNQGFSVERLEIPDLAMKSGDITFDWIAIGRQKGYEQRPEIIIPSEEERKAEELKEQEELEQNALYRQQMLEKQARRDAEREQREREEQERGELE